jgi:hypothetical protein
MAGPYTAENTCRLNQASLGMESSRQEEKRKTYEYMAKNDA